MYHLYPSKSYFSIIIDDTTAWSSMFGLAFGGSEYAKIEPATTESFNIKNPSHLNIWI